MERARYNTEPYSNRSPPPNIMLNRPTFGGHIMDNDLFGVFYLYGIGEELIIVAVTLSFLFS